MRAFTVAESTYPDDRADEIQRQTVPQHGLNKHPQNKHVDPNHHGLTPRCSTKPKGLTPELPLVPANALDLLLLFFLPTFDVLEIARNPFVLTTPVDKLRAVLLERRDGVKGELVVRRHEGRGSGHDHGRHRLICLEEFLHLLSGNSDKVRFNVFGIADKSAGIND